LYTTPLVSIITPSYNASKFIEETLESILKQTYSNWELIIIDDCSTDNSIEILQPYIEQDSRIKVLLNETNLGAASSRNRGLDIANGDYIAFLDSDDLWLPQKLSKQIAFMQQENVLLSYTSYYAMNETGRTIGLYTIKSKTTYHDLLKTSSIGTLTTIYSAKELGKFYFKQIGHEDYVMKLSILKRIPFAKGIQEPLAKYRILSNSLSSNKIKVATWQWYIYRNIEKLSLLKSIYYFMHYTYYGFTKYKKM